MEMKPYGAYFSSQPKYWSVLGKDKQYVKGPCGSG